MVILPSALVILPPLAALISLELAALSGAPEAVTSGEAGAGTGFSITDFLQEKDTAIANMARQKNKFFIARVDKVYKCLFVYRSQEYKRLRFIQMAGCINCDICLMNCLVTGTY